MLLSPLTKMRARKTGYSFNTLYQSRSSCAPTGVRLISTTGVSVVESKQNIIAKGFQPPRSRKTFNCGSGTLIGARRQTAWTNVHSLTVPEHVRQLSTSAEGGAGIKYSIQETKNATGNIATVSIANPAKMNIVNSSILEQLVTTCRELSKDEALRAVILTGGRTAEGKSASFIGGADIKEMNALSSSEDAKTFINKIHSACQALRDLPVPVIARVHGFSLGAGLEIMAACDLRIATKDSIFGMPEVKVGIPSVVEAALLPGLMGMGRTRRLLYLAENISAKEALEWGLVEKLVEDEPALDAAVNEWAETIAGMGPKAIRIQKKLMQSWENGTVDEGIQAGVDAFGKAYADGGTEPKSMMGHFINRRR